MLEKITNTFSDVFRKITGKSTITEKNIEEAVEQIKIALLEADVNLRVVRRFVIAQLKKLKVKKFFVQLIQVSNLSKLFTIKSVPYLGTKRKIYN